MISDQRECSSINSESNDSLEEFLCSLENDSGNEDGTFYFETDYLALKGNPDYLKLMRTLAILEVQRIKTSQVIIFVKITLKM